MIGVMGLSSKRGRWVFDRRSRGVSFSLQVLLPTRITALSRCIWRLVVAFPSWSTRRTANDLDSDLSFQSSRARNGRVSDQLKFYGSSFLAASSSHPRKVVGGVGFVEFGERHDTRTNGQHYTAV